MTLGEWSVLSAYFACMALLAVYGLHRLCLVVLHLRHRRLPPFTMPSLEALPALTVHLPAEGRGIWSARLSDPSPPPRHPERFQSGGPRGGAEDRHGRIRCHLRCRLSSSA
ncbi:MAG: hypothetical protein DMF49_13190 [Acidobacteria bacterium]|nr:MAG: hypothetical protein DMF49_13190 [Acidobacteriota bacterium]